LTPARSVFAVFDQVLLTVHPADCSVRDVYAALPNATTLESRRQRRQAVVSPADLMLRIVNQMVDDTGAAARADTPA
jgi:hypothetical protein